MRSTAALLGAVLALLGCGPRTGDGTTAPTATGTPVGTPSGMPTATGSSTSTGATSGAVAGERIELASGEVWTGQVIAVYDQSVWWDAADERWLAVFDPALAADWPDDRRLRFVAESQVVDRQSVSVAGPSWTEHLRQLGVVWETVPVEPVAWVIRGNDGYHLEEDGFGDFAWDLVRTDDQGVRYQGAGAANADFAVWQEPVYAAAGGTVVEVVRSAVDNPPGSYPPGAVNNLVGVKLSGQLYQYYLHFEQGSIPADLSVGDAVGVGDFLGRVGNSGVTLEPHLHLTLHYWDSAHERYWSVPSEWRDVYRGDAVGQAADLRDWHVPLTGEWLDDAAFGGP